MLVKVTRYDFYPYHQDSAPWVVVEASSVPTALHVGKVLLRDIPLQRDEDGYEIISDIRREEWSTRRAIANQAETFGPEEFH